MNSAVLKAPGIGFGAEVRATSQSRTLTESFKDVEPEDLVKYGLIPEFIGRLPVVATLTELDLAALMQILSRAEKRAGETVWRFVPNGKCRAGVP